jgi:hypothetical protein
MPTDKGDGGVTVTASTTDNKVTITASGSDPDAVLRAAQVVARANGTKLPEAAPKAEAGK